MADGEGRPILFGLRSPLGILAAVCHARRQSETASGKDTNTMGMDLKPVRPSKDAPTDKCGVVWGRYNWSGWSWILAKLDEWGVDLSEFDGANDGKRISAKTCRTVADAIEKHLPELSVEDRKWLAPHVILWRTCGGYRQY